MTVTVFEKREFRVTGVQPPAFVDLPGKHETLRLREFNNNDLATRDRLSFGVDRETHVAQVDLRRIRVFTSAVSGEFSHAESRALQEALDEQSDPKKIAREVNPRPGSFNQLIIAARHIALLVEREVEASNRTKTGNGDYPFVSGRKNEEAVLEDGSRIILTLFFSGGKVGEVHVFPSQDFFKTKAA